MKKILAALILFVMINVGMCSAESIHAVGRGITQRAAVHDAMRNAIEQKFGATVHSKTRVQNHMLIADETALDSSGFISGWKIVYSGVEKGIFVVTVVVELDDEKLSARLRQIDKKALVDFNSANPRVAVLAFDSFGLRYTEIENEIINAMQNQGFTRIVDLAQVNRAVLQRIRAAEGNFALCKTLANDFHADCLVIAEIKRLDDVFTVSSRFIELNTGEILFAGTSTGGGAFITNADALKLAARRAGNEISAAALKSAANIEHHLTLLITPQTFQRLGGTLTAVRQQIMIISGVNDVFARKMTSSLELDVNFDGTAADFAQALESQKITILELQTGYIKI